MISSGNLIPESYKFAHLACSCGRTTLRSAKSHISTMLFILASEYLSYHWAKWITTVTMRLSVSLYYSKCLKWLLSARTQLQSLLWDCLIDSSTLLCWNSVYVSNSHFHTTTRLHRKVVHGTQDLGQECWLAICRDTWTNLTAIFTTCKNVWITLLKYDFSHFSR